MRSIEISSLRGRNWFLSVSVLALISLGTIGPAAAAEQQLTTVAPIDLGEGGPVAEASLGGLKDAAMDDEGNLYIPDITFSVVWKVTPSGQLTRIAGTGVYGDSGATGLATEEKLSWPFSLALDPDGILYISNLGANWIRAVNLTNHTVHVLGKIKIKSGESARVVGNGLPFGFSGDGGPAVEAQLAGPRGLALHRDSPHEPLSLYISDVDNRRVRRADGKTGIISTVAGTGCPLGRIDGEGGDPCDDLGDGRPPTQAAISAPTGVAFDSFGNLFIIAFDGWVRKVKNGVISTISGSHGPGFFGDNGPAKEAGFAGNPHAPVFDSAGNFFIADADNNRVRRFEAIDGEVTADSIVTTVVGNGFAALAFGFGYYSVADNGNFPTVASVDVPTGLAFHDGRLYLVQESGVIRVVDPGADDLVDGSGDEKIFDIGAQGGIKWIFGIAADAFGNVIATEITAARIRAANAGGQVSTVSGTGVQAYTIDGPGGDLRDDPIPGVPASQAVHGILFRLGFDPEGSLYVTEWYPTRLDPPAFGISGSVRKIVAENGVIGPNSRVDTVADLMGDPAFISVGIAVESAKRQYIADAINQQIWAIEDGSINPNPIAKIEDVVFGMALDETKENLYFAELFNAKIRRVHLATGDVTTIFELDSPAGECCGFFATANDLVVSGNDLYVVDQSYERVLRIDLSASPPSGTLAAGIGPDPLFPPFPSAFNGDGNATKFELDDPVAITVDPQGVIYTGEERGQRIRRLE